MVLYVTKNRGKLLIFGKVGCLWQCVVRMFLQPISPHTMREAPVSFYLRTKPALLFFFRAAASTSEREAQFDPDGRGPQFFFIGRIIVVSV